MFWGTFLRGMAQGDSVEIIWPFLYVCDVFQITGTSTRPFQLTVEKLEKALQDARAEVSVAELFIIGLQVFKFFVLSQRYV